MRLVPELFPCAARQFHNIRWGQILDFPSLYGVVEIVSSGNAQEEGVAIVTRVNRYFSSLSQLPKRAELHKKMSTKLIKSLLICLQTEQKCELAILGEGKIFLRRGKILAPLLVREGILVGEIHSGDCLIFLSSTALSILSMELHELFSPRLSPKEIAEAITIRLTQEEEKAEGATALVVQIKAQEQDVVTRPLSRGNPLGVSLVRLFQSLRQRTTHPKFLPLLGVVICTLLFCISVFLGIRRQQNDVSVRAREQAQESAKRLFDEGVALTDLQPIKSRELLQQAADLVAPYKGKNLPKGKEGKSLENLQHQIDDSLKIVSKVNTANVQLFYDASFLQKGRVISSFTVGSDELAFADTSAGMIGVVSLTSKDAEIVAGGSEYTTTKFLAFQDKRLLIVTNDGVKAITAGKEDVTKILSPEESWDSFTTFGGNLYGVNRSTSEIIRYPVKDNGFGTKETYLAEDIHTDLSKTLSIVIDGSVWLGSSIGKIFRYTQGRDDPFLIRGVDPPLGQHLEVFVTDESPYAFVYDPEEKRVVILTKEGTYQAQYVWNDTIVPTAFAVSPEKKRIFLLSDKKIYSFSME